MKGRIENELIELGFSPIYLGFDYWQILVELICTNNRISLEQIYMVICDKYGCKRNSVEQALRYAMQSANHKAITEYCNGTDTITIKTLSRWLKFNLGKENR